MNNTIHLPIKREWFDMILSGEKKEEYREFKPYWVKRLLGDAEAYKDPCPVPTKPTYFEKPENVKTITFVNGYGNHRPTMVVEFLNLDAKIPNPEWCPPGTKGYWFALKLGRVLETKNLNQ